MNLCELVYFSRHCGVTPAFALYSATLGNAKIARIDDRVGTIETEKIAEMVVTAGNPLEDLTTLRNISAVISRGRHMEQPKVKKMKNVERELDKFL